MKPQGYRTMSKPQKTAAEQTDVGIEELLDRYLTELDIKIAIQSLSPELREVIYKEYVENMARTALASNPEAGKK